MEATVSTTPEALAVINRLETAYGPLMFFQSGGCCEGSSPMCLRQGEMPISPYDLKLGMVGGAPFYIDEEQYERWGRPRFVIDVQSGASEGFSLEGRENVHFVTLAVEDGWGATR